MLYFIVNKAAKGGRGRENWQTICSFLKEKGIEYKAYLTEYEGHATKLAEQISSLPDEDICMVVVGGDGTINEALNGIRDFGKVRFAVIPNGSGNDFVRGMKVPTVPIEAIARITEVAAKGPDTYRPTDLGQVKWNGQEKQMSRVFGISSGVGLDAIVTRDVDSSKLKKVLNFFHLGNLTYSVLTVIDLFAMDTGELEISVEKADGSVEKIDYKKLIFMAAMNQFAEGGGVPMAPKALNNDGLLSFCCAHGIPKWRTFLMFPFLLAAKHEKFKGFDIFEGRSATYKISKPFALHTDGEYLGEVEEVTYSCLPGILRYMDCNS